MMRRRSWGVVGGLLLAGLTLVGCSKAPVLGVLLPISGDAATYGKSMSDAMHLALDEATAEGSLPSGFQAVWADSGSDPVTGVTEFRRLVNQNGARLVIGGCKSDVARALLPVIADEQIILLSPSASAPDLTKKSKLFYRLFPSDELEGTRAGTFLFKEQLRRKVLIFSSGSEHARGIEPEFRQQYEQNFGGKVVGRILLTDPNWQREAADRITTEQPDAAYIIAYADDAVEVLKLLRKKRFRGTRCVTSAFYNRAVLDANRRLVEGVFFPLPSFDPESDEKLVKDFVTAYRERFGVVPDIFAAHAYDAMRVALDVIKQTGYLDTEDLNKTLHFGITDFPGVTGTIRFDDYGDVRHNPIMYIVSDGKVKNFKRYREDRLRDIRNRFRHLVQSSDPTPTP